MSAPRDDDSALAATAARSGVADAATGSPPEPRFLRGLTIGILVGAAIAGSAMWERLRRRDALPAGNPGEEESRPG